MLIRKHDAAINEGEWKTFLASRDFGEFTAGGHGRDVPIVVRAGLRAVRAYDAADDLIDGDVIPGADIEGLICRFLENDRVAYLHVYSATAGCFTCRVDRS